MARLDDGFSTLISFAQNPTVKIYEKEVTPPSVEGGGANDTTTMRNTAYRTKAPKRLKTLGDSATKVAYQVAAYPEIIAMINVNQLITITFPDASTLVFWGYIDSFTPSALTEGAQPTADIKIVCTNQNSSGVETAPVQTG